MSMTPKQKRRQQNKRKCVAENRNKYANHLVNLLGNCYDFSAVCFGLFSLSVRVLCVWPAIN